MLSQQPRFVRLGLPVPKVLDTYPVRWQDEVYAYLSQLNELQRQAYCIAHDHLESSFHIVRSNGFLAWKQQQQQL